MYVRLFICISIILTGFMSAATGMDNYSEPWRVVSYTQNEGLPEGKMYGIFIQKNGITWAGTQNGIAKFDGYKWRNISFIKSPLSSNKNFVVQEFNDNTIICLHNDTLYEIKNNKYRKLLYTIDNAIQQIFAYVLLPNGTEYFLTHENQASTIVKLIQKKGKHYQIIKTFNNAPKTHYMQLFQNNDNSVVFNDGKQLFYINNRGTLNPIGSKFNWFIKLVNTQTDTKGNLYFYIVSDYSINGIYTYTREGKLIKENPFASNLCKSFDIDKLGNIIAVSDVGKTLIKSNGTWKEIGLFENYNNKYFIKCESNGNLWIGSLNKIYCYNAIETKCKTISVGNTYETNSINDIFIDKEGNTWLAKYKGITLIDKHNNQKEILQIEGKDIQDITTINQDRDGNIWFGSGIHNNSTYKYNGKTFERIGASKGLSDKSVHKIWKDLEGNLWFSVFDNDDIGKGYTAGVYKLVKNNFFKPKDINDVLNNTRLHAMLFAKNGAIWLGSIRGLMRYQNNNLTHWEKLGDEPIGKVSDITTDNDGKVWFASAKYGISTITNDKIISLSKKNETDFPLDYCDIQFDKYNTLWYGGKEYLTAMQNNFYYRIGSAEGLSAQASWPVKYYHNKLFIGTFGGGLNILDLNQINQAKPIIEITDIQREEKSMFVEWKGFAKDKIFNNSKIRAAWRIDNKEWHINSNGEIAIHELDYGDHIFEIKTLSELPNQSDNNITRITIEIYYPFYLTKHFIIPILALLCILFFGAYYYIKSQAKSAKLIKQKEEHLTNLGGSLPIIPFVINEKGIVLESFVNKKNKYVDIELTNNKKLTNQLPDKYREKLEKAIRNCFTYHTQESVEITYTKYGNEVAYEIRFSPYLSELEQEIKTAICVAINISQTKKNETELIKARQVAESADRAKMLFLTNMSHEIRTPMNAIVGITDILLGDITDTKFKDNLNIIKHSADNLLVIINDILDFSKIEAGKIELESIEFDVFELIDNLIKTFEIKTIQKRIYFRANIDNSMPKQLIGDPFRLNQILVNLISNAIKFTDIGGITFNAIIQNIDENDIKIKFEIRDTGIGIAPSKIDTIFESFTQESNVITRKYGGTGLGLTISKRLIEMQKGSIRVESNTNMGSLFIVELPFGISKKLTPFKKEASKLKDLTDLRILVVEDNNMNQIVAKQILQKWNAKVDTVNNGLEAIEILSVKSYDVILMDLQMPIMDGYEATKIIRDETSKVLNHKVPIIALTADAFPEIKRKSIEYGMNDFITKPFKQDELFVKLTKHGYQLD